MNDVFISYRRHNGEAWAAHLKDLLSKRGVRCYLDKHKKRTKDFKEALFRNIEQSTNFLLVLSENIFNEKVEEIDWVRDEIDHAKKQNKNIVAVMFNGYEPSQVDWESDERISFLETFECLKFDDTNINLRDASIDTIIQYLVDETGKPWKNTLKDNNSWYGETISDEDREWMIANMDVCKRMDLNAFEHIVNNPIFANKKEIRYFSLMAYDIESLHKRISSFERILENSNRKINVYGLCHKYDLEKAEELFGKNHFLEFSSEYDFDEVIKQILYLNHINYLDLIDMILVLKDCTNPEKVLIKAAKLLDPTGGAIYVRDLDDDLIIAYPDEAGLVDKALELLDLDPGAGNRIFGKRIYTCLSKSGADEIRMLDDDVTTANFKTAMQRRICDAYFSYLIPEFRILVNDNPNNEDYYDALCWLDQHYQDLESLFGSKEFYFRSGYISGYGIYVDEGSLDY